MSTSGSSTPTTGYYKLPPIITTEADRVFLNEVNNFIDSELSKVDHLDKEQRYLVYKAVFNKVIEHVTAYKPVLTLIKKEYEDTIEIIKNGQREAAFLQGKLKAMASEPSTLRNYKKRADELEDRMAVVRKDNERLQKELQVIQAMKEERDKRPKTAEAPKRQLKKDSRLIPGLSLEEATDMKVLQRKFETLDRQLKELNISLKARFLPKTTKVQLKETLDNKVDYRDQLLWQSQVYKARGQKLKIALEAAQAYNQMKPPHQTVGDAVTIAFHQASGMLKAEREKAEGEQSEAAQTTTFEDDDPNKEKEAEMMLEYIEKFNEQFEDGLYEEAAVHAANSPKGILRTQATLAKFRDVKVKTIGRSPLLAFCDAMMSSVKAAGNKPNEALSMDCVQAGLKENRLDLVYHWLAQDRLTISHNLGKMIADHCSCQLPCKCGCQALAQNIFIKVKAHDDALLSMLNQGKIQAALQYARHWHCINSENVKDILAVNVCQELINGLMVADKSGKKPYLNLTVGKVLMSLVELDKPEQTTHLVHAMLTAGHCNSDETGSVLPMQKAVALDRTTTSEEWMTIMQFLDSNGQSEMALQILATTTVVDIVMRAWGIAQEEKKGVSFSMEIQTKSDSDHEDEDSSCGMSVRSRESTSFDRSSRETSPDVPLSRKSPKESILKKRPTQGSADGVSSADTSPRKSPPLTRKKKGVRVSGLLSPPPKTSGQNSDAEENEDVPDTRQSTAKGSGGGVRFMDNDPYTSNPESAGESEAE